MIFGTVWRDGGSKLVVVPSAFKLNQQTYKKECLVPLRRDLRYEMRKEVIILYQDKAPYHIAKSVQ